MFPIHSLSSKDENESLLFSSPWLLFMNSYGALLSFVIVDVAWHIDIGRFLDDMSENGILNLTRTFDTVSRNYFPTVVLA